MIPDSKEISMQGIFSGRTFCRVGAIGLVGVSCEVANAATIFVSLNAGGLNNGTSWVNAYTSLQAGINAAGVGDEVWVKAATYKPHASTQSVSFELKDQVKVFGGFAGTETQLSQRNPVTNVTILSGDLGSNDGANFTNYSVNSHHVVTAASGVTALQTGAIKERINLDGFTIRSGNGGGTTPFGGGIYITGSSPVIRNCKITLCKAVAGGGIYADDASSAVIRNCEITGNLATDNAQGTAGGGAMFVYGPCAILNSTISDNVSEGNAGGVRSHSAANTHVRIVSCSILNNQADADGGGMLGAGGNSSDSRLSLVNCLIAGNSIEVFGDGGGVRTGEVSVTMDNCTVADNSAVGSGGGWFFWRGSGASAPIIRNSILYSNAAFAGADIWANSSGHTVSHCIFGVGGGQPAGTTSNNSNADPKFMSPSAGNYQLSCGTPISPAIDSGDTSLARTDDEDVNEDGVTTTQLAADRLLRFRTINAVDRGAYEKHPGGGCLAADLSPSPCGNGLVDIDDLLQVINSWGQDCDVNACWGDANANGVVDIDDLLLVINSWGFSCATQDYENVGSLTSVEDCMDVCSVDYTAWTAEWTECVNKCVDGLCQAQIIECD